MASVKATASLAGPSRLGDYLDCPAELIERALQLPEARSPGKRLGDLLIDSQLVPREKVLEGLRAQRVDRLHSCPTFSQLEERELYELSISFEEVTVPAGTQFITQDTHDPYLYVLASGRLEVFRSDHEGGETLLAMVFPVEPIGEMAYFTDGVRSACVRALETSQMLRVHYEKLTQLLNTMPRAAEAFMGVVSRRLIETNTRFQEAHQRYLRAERSIEHVSDFLDMADGEAVELGIDALLERLVERVRSLMGSSSASLYLLGDDERCTVYSSDREAAPARSLVPAGLGIAGWVAERRRAVNIGDAYKDRRFDARVDHVPNQPSRTVLCGPLCGLDNEVIGVVQVANKIGGAFNHDDESVLRLFARQAAVAVENFRLYERLTLSHAQKSVLLDIATTIGDTLELGTLIRRIVAKTVEVLACERSSFFVVDHEGRELWSMEAHGSELQEIRLPMSTGLAGHTASTGEIVNVADAYLDPRFNATFDRESGFRTRSVLCVPVRNRNGVIVGVTQAINKRGGAFAAQDAELLRAISTQIGIALENAQLHSHAVDMMNYLESVQESISSSIVTLDLDYRIVTTNRAARTLLGRMGEALPGTDLRDLLGGENADLLGQVARVYAAGRAALQYDLDLRVSGGDSSTVNAHVLPLADGSDMLKGVVMVLEDMTSEKEVRRTLSRYMTDDVVETVLLDPKQQVLGGVRNMASILFSDIRGFTSIAERLGDDQTMILLNEYFSLMVEEVFAHKGVLDKFMGDALMAVFGIPFMRHDDAVRAVRTALRMREVLGEFNRSRSARGLPPVEIGVGINTDEVLAGNIGSKARMDYTVIGDGVNVSARLESLNKMYGTSILIGESTAKRLGDHFVLRLIDHVVVAGKVRPVQVYEVLGDRDYRLSAAQEHFVRGIESYRARKFREAYRRFQRGAAEDAVCRAFARRCVKLMVTAPPADWDGVWRPAWK